MRSFRLLGAVGLRVWPRSFRRQLGAPMLAAFVDDCVAFARRHGHLRALAHALRAAAELARQGMAERLGGRSATIHDHRSPGEESMLDRLFVDLRYAMRALRRAPLFTLVATLTLATGIGANTAIFSVVNGVLLAPLPYEEPDRLVAISTRFKERAGVQLSEPELIDLRARTSSFVAVGAMNYQRLTLGGAAEPERIRVNQLTADVLPMLGVDPLMGRVFSAAEDVPDAERVVVISQALWQSGLGADPQVLGRSIDLENIPHTVIGVMPAGFAYPTPETRAWIPLRLDLDEPWERNNHYLYAIARLAPGIGIEAADAELGALATELIREFPEFYGETEFGLDLVGMLEYEVGDVRASLWMLLAAVAFVLLVACANVAHLMLARAAARRHELAVRAALGSGRGAIVRQLLAESLLLATIGGAVGLLLAYQGGRALLAMAPDALPRVDNVGVDGIVLAFSVAISLLTSLIFGLAPAALIARMDPQEGLREESLTATGSRRGRRSRALLVVAEVAMAAILVIGGWMVIRSFMNLRAIDPGFEHEGVLTMQLALPAAEYEEPPDIVRFYEATLEELRALPGVEGAGAVARLPLARGANRWSLQIEGKMAATTADAPVGQIQQATPGYFEVMRLRLLQGRFFGPADRADAAPVAMVSRSFAELHWPAGGAVGSRVKVFLEEWPWMEVVGVVDDVKQLGLDTEPYPKIYFPHAQSWRTAYVSPTTMHVVVRADGDPATLATAAREAVWRVNPRVPVSAIATMEQVLAASIGRERFVATLLSLFASVGLLLAAVGIAGVMAFVVAGRTREIGIRMALGARRGDVLRLVVAPALGLTGLGVALGVLGSIPLSRRAEALLYGVPPIDPPSYGVVAAAFLLVALAASWLPARRATSVSPVSTLRGSSSSRSG